MPVSKPKTHPGLFTEPAKSYLRREGQKREVCFQEALALCDAAEADALQAEAAAGVIVLYNPKVHPQVANAGNDNGGNPNGTYDDGEGVKPKRTKN